MPMLELNQRLSALAIDVKQQLTLRQRRLVLAESCTCGLIASTLGSVPGISDVFCGSAVTYRNETKASWLNVSRDALDDPNIGAVSEIVAEQMAQGGINATPEADLAASVTGHLGPGAPPSFDGVIFIGIASRGQPSVTVLKRTVSAEAPQEVILREFRRREAVAFVLEAILDELERFPN
ncbi:CinA family protein [Planctomicrobium sp. SH527]|uniref:CinA family protein n=1 Tax=Planctomicrobium sp. SH527 TaxID=3448123 RepID=UPI003F5B3972